MRSPTRRCQTSSDSSPRGNDDAISSDEEWNGFSDRETHADDVEDWEGALDENEWQVYGSTMDEFLSRHTSDDKPLTKADRYATGALVLQYYYAMEEPDGGLR